MTNEMRTFLIGCFLASLPTAGMTQTEGLFQQTWIQQYSNGNSAYFENMLLVDEAIIACGQWFQGSMANQMVVSLQADNGEVNWQHYRDCCSDHARYYTPKLIDGTLYCFGTQNGQGSSYFDAMYVKYDVESGAELDYNIWNYGGSNGFTDVVVQDDGSFTVLSSAASVQPLARFVEDEIAQSGSIPNQPEYQRLKGITERDGALYAYGAWEGYNYPGIIKLTSNLNVEWSRSVGSAGNRRVFCGLSTSDGFILGGRDHNLEHGFLVASDAEANLTSEVTFPPILYDKSSIGSIAAFEDGYLITLRDYDEDEVTTWLFALDEDLSMMAQIQLAPDMQFVNGSISGRPSAGQILLHNQDVYVTGYEKDGGFETPTMVKLAFQFNPIPGCTDVDACNFNPEATVDDESCFEAPFIAAFGVDADSVSTCSGESITLSAMGTTSALDSTLLDAFTMTVNSYYSRTTPVLESGHTYRLIGNGRYGFADGWSHNDPAWNYAWDQETGSKVYCNGTQDASEDVRWLYDGAANFQRPDNDYHNNDNNAFCNGSDKTYAWTIEGDGNAHVISWEDCCYGDNSGSLDFWLYELTGVPGGPETTWSTGNQGATTELTPSESQWVTLTTMLDGISLCQDSIWIEVVTSGCNDENACNYSMLDVCSVDCVYPLVGEDCEAGAVACAEGTVWDAESQTCVVAIPAYLNEPGEAAILNPCYFDSNGNGLVEVTDLMNVLSVYGMECGEIPEAAEFSCGDPLNYQGYDYETVLIGDQCWFAENLRSTNYRNGDEIDTDLSLEDWSAINGGATSVYGEGESACNDDSPVIDACDDALALLAFGRLYNGAAITDSRQLCPAGWGVPTDMAWTQLTDFLGGLASAGDALKSTENWYGGGNGTNDSGFDGEPGGYRNFLSEQFYNGGSSGYWWSQSPSGASELFIRSIDWNGNGSINVQSRSVQNSYSVRCLKSVE